VIWLVYASASPGTYALFQSFNTSILGRIVLGGWLFSAFYTCATASAPVLGCGYGFELKDAYRSGWIVVAVSLVATIVSWIAGLRLV